jgi:hypothetical protein
MPLPEERHSDRYENLRCNITAVCSVGMVLEMKHCMAYYVVCEYVILVTEPIVCDYSFAQFINCENEHRPVSSVQ